eukprot:1928071-Amphidinium_carterae.1
MVISVGCAARLVRSFPGRAQGGVSHYGPQVAGHKGVYDVNSHADFWSWMNHGLIPLLYIQDTMIHSELEIAEGISVVFLFELVFLFVCGCFQNVAATAFAGTEA